MVLSAYFSACTFINSERRTFTRISTLWYCWEYFQGDVLKFMTTWSPEVPVDLPRLGVFGERRQAAGVHVPPHVYVDRGVGLGELGG